MVELLRYATSFKYIEGRLVKVLTFDKWLDAKSYPLVLMKVLKIHKKKSPPEVYNSNDKRENQNQ